MKLLVVIGECMAELSPASANTHRLGYAGDTFNAAWTARLLLPPETVVRYVTAIGTDWISDGLHEVMREAGLDLSAVARLPSRSIGLYAVRLVDGERSFAYWRAGSAATTLADDPTRLAASVAGADWIVISGITLAILRPEARDVLYDALRDARRAGARIVLDTNYRPQLWRTPDEARGTVIRFAGIADCALPSFSDEALLFGDASPVVTAERFAMLGVEEVVVKDGPGPAWCLAHGEGVWVKSCPVDAPIDTTGAGDAFNGAYLGARLGGLSPVEAAAEGHRVASIAVRTRGALIPRDIAVRSPGRLEATIQ